MSETGEGIGKRRFHYGWVVVATGTILMASNMTVIYSFAVFFKPLALDFGWNRATTSAVQSVFLICFGLFAVVAGWMADRFGPSRVLAACGLLSGLGLILTSRVNELWQIWLTYSLMTGAGLCSTFPVTGIATARWYVERRGLALGIVAAGSGLGNLVGVPSVARLVADLGWSRAYFILGVVTLVITVAGALLLSRRPEKMALRQPRANAPASPGGAASRAAGNSAAILAALRTRSLWMLYGVFFLFAFCNHLVMVHLVNYATDLGNAALVAATIISVIGFSSIVGRVLMGTASDRIGNLNTLVIASAGIALALTWLVFAREMWMLYLFAVVFGFSQGAEIPQQTALIGKYFGLQVALVGIVHSGVAMGGALGSWVGGFVFDLSQSYQVAFFIGATVILCALATTLTLKRRDKARITRLSTA